MKCKERKQVKWGKIELDKESITSSKQQKWDLNDKHDVKNVTSANRKL